MLFPLIVHRVIKPFRKISEVYDYGSMILFIITKHEFEKKVFETFTINQLTRSP